MKKATTSDLETRLSRFLFQYCITPHTTAGVSPAELLMGRQPRSHLNLMRPQVGSRVQANQFRQKVAHDKRARNRSFELGGTVFIKNFADGPTWLQGVVTALHGLFTYDVKLGDGRVVRRHIDHVQSGTSHPPLTEVVSSQLLFCLTHLVQALSQQLHKLNFDARQGCQGHRIN